MKKVALVFVSALSLISIVLAFSNLPQKKETSVKETPEVLGVPAEAGIEIPLADKKYRAYFFKVSEAFEISLWPNFNEKETASDFRESQRCRALVSGGYYTPDSKPTGYFVSQGKEIRKYAPSTLTNAIYSINDFETPRITREEPRDHLRVALQTGPLLMENSYSGKLNLLRDESARRVIVAVTGANETVFAVFYDPESVFSGPYLRDLPQAVAFLSEEAELNLADAVTLDGGTASAFYFEEIKLPEASSVGSFFCVR